MNIRIGQAILAIVVALSVATLPMGGGFIANSKTMEMSASVAVPDCGHHHHAPSNKTQKTANDCASMAGCALKCFNFTGLTLSRIAFSSPAGAALDPIRVSDDVLPRTGTLPFRPPRA
jgi:hypothetical protein